MISNILNIFWLIGGLCIVALLVIRVLNIDISRVRDYSVSLTGWKKIIKDIIGIILIISVVVFFIMSIIRS